MTYAGNWHALLGVEAGRVAVDFVLPAEEETAMFAVTCDVLL